MLEGKRIGALILLAGEGKRFGAEVPKQFALLGDKRVYLHTLETFQRLGFFDEIVLVCHSEGIETVREETSGCQVVAGGTTRQKSSFEGLKSFKEKPHVVVIHDAVRPFVTEKILLDNALGALQHGAVDTCIPSADTLVYAPNGRTIAEIPKRAEFMRGQTPQSFRFDWIVRAHEEAESSGVEATDDCSLVLRMGLPVHVVAGCERNIKITTPFDLAVANNLLMLALPHSVEKIRD